MPTTVPLSLFSPTPVPEAVLGALVGAGLATGVALLVVAVTGTVHDPAVPPGRAARTVAAARTWAALPGASGRVVAAVLAGMLALAVTGWPVAGAGIGVLVLAWPALFGGAAAERASTARLEGLAAWTESLRDTVAGHASLEHAIPVAAANAAPALAPALDRLTGQIRARAPLEHALRDLAADLDDPAADLVIAALILNVRRRGDRLAEVLTGLAATAREELDQRRRVTAGRAGVRRGVHIVIGMTIAFAAFLAVFGGPYVRPYDTPTGQVALAGVIALFAAGFAWMRRLSDVRPARPFLARPQPQAPPGGPVATEGVDDARIVEAILADPTYPSQVATGRWAR